MNVPDEQTSAPGHLLPDISGAAQSYIDICLMCVGCTCVGALGTVANTVNFIVLKKQGFSDCVSLCLLSLTFSDFSTSVLTVVYSVCYALSLSGLVYYVDPLSVMYYFSWVRGMTFDLSMLTTAFISVERCLSILIPLKFKNFATFKRAKIVMFVIYTITLGAYSVPYATQGFSRKWDPNSNSTRVFIWVSSHRAQIEFYLTTAFHMVNGTICEIIVLVSTVGMIRGLQKSDKFRHSSKSPSTKDRSISNKNKCIVKMISILAAVFIFCNMFRLLLLYLRRLIPDIMYGRRLHNTYNTLIGINFFFGTFNSSVNIFVYYSLKPSFKAMFLSTFCMSQVPLK